MALLAVPHLTEEELEVVCLDRDVPPSELGPHEGFAIAPSVRDGRGWIVEDALQRAYGASHLRRGFDGIRRFERREKLGVATDLPFGLDGAAHRGHPGGDTGEALGAEIPDRGG